MTSDKDGNLTRRNFIAGAGLTGVGSVLALAGMGSTAEAQEAGKALGAAQPVVRKDAKVPTRVFGRTKEEVSILSFGGIFDITENHALLQKALDWGVTYWDTANGYSGGNSEIGIGTFFEKFPEVRKKIFLVTKSGNKSPKGMTELLNTSLQRLKTDYIDLYFMHAVSNPNELTPEMKAWAEQAKKEKKIKYFGFSTHSNMESCLMAASKLGWIDGIMTTYGFRLMDKPEMKAAIEACHKAGIGLTAMKTQQQGARKSTTEAELKIINQFLEKGMTPQQASVKVVWGNEMISAVCCAMYTLNVLTSNVAAAVDGKKLTSADIEALRRYAAVTCDSYCAGCQNICEGALGEDHRIADVMRYMMYHSGYGDVHWARQQFAQLPEEVRVAIGGIDYSAAEQACPQGLAITELMRKAKSMLG